MIRAENIGATHFIFSDKSSRVVMTPVELLSSHDKRNLLILRVNKSSLISNYNSYTLIENDIRWVTFLGSIFSLFSSSNIS